MEITSLKNVLIREDDRHALATLLLGTIHPINIGFFTVFYHNNSRPFVLFPGYSTTTGMKSFVVTLPVFLLFFHDIFTLHYNAIYICVL